MGDGKRVTFLVGRPEGKTPRGRPSHRWVGIIKMDIGKTGIGGCVLNSCCSGMETLVGVIHTR